MELMCYSLTWLHIRVTLFLLIFNVEHISTNTTLSIGKAMNVFGRYGYYSVSMKVVPRNDTGKPFIFREPVVDVFKNTFEESRCLKEPNSPFHGEFHMEFCDNLDQLLQAYFRDFEIELADRPWRAFTASWSDITIAKKLGILVDYVSVPRTYVLVRLLRRRECKKMKRHLTAVSSELLPFVKEQAGEVKVGNATSVTNFIKKYGSHYISAYSTGNSLFQVYVYHPPVYARLKARLQTYGVSSLTKDEMYTFFSPWYAEELGSIISASGNKTLVNWAKSSLTSTSHLYPYTSLMRLYGNTEHLKELDKLLQNEALLGLKLNTLAPIFKDPKKRKWFVEVLHNNLQLWDLNM